jgi:hypothetical protein
LAALEKTFKCLSCDQEIKLERKPNNSGWNRFEADGVTSHNCSSSSKKKQQQFPKSELADIHDEVHELRAYIKTLVTQVPLMRQELQKNEMTPKGACLQCGAYSPILFVTHPNERMVC